MNYMNYKKRLIEGLSILKSTRPNKEMKLMPKSTFSSSCLSRLFESSSFDFGVWSSTLLVWQLNIELNWIKEDQIRKKQKNKKINNKKNKKIIKKLNPK